MNALRFNSANIALFERPSAPAGEKQGMLGSVLQKLGRYGNNSLITTVAIGYYSPPSERGL